MISHITWGGSCWQASMLEFYMRNHRVERKNKCIKFPMFKRHNYLFVNVSFICIFHKSKFITRYNNLILKNNPLQLGLWLYEPYHQSFWTLTWFILWRTYAGHPRCWESMVTGSCTVQRALVQSSPHCPLALTLFVPHDKDRVIFDVKFFLLHYFFIL